MAIVLASEPIITIVDKESTWNAASNPIIFKCTRKDFSGFTIVSTVSLTIRFTGTNIASSFTPGELFTTGTETITVNTSVFSGGNTDVDFLESNVTFEEDGTGIDWINRLSVPSIPLILTGTINDESASFTYYHNRAGIFNIDVSSICRAYLTDMDFLPIPSGGFDVEEEVDKWVSVDLNTDQVGLIFEALKIINAANQIGYTYGSNLIEYLGAGYSDDDSDPGYFLTKFDAPRIYEGWPFSLSFLFNRSGAADSREFYLSIDGTDEYTSTMLHLAGNKLFRVTCDEMIEGDSIKIEMNTTNSGILSVLQNFVLDGTYVAEPLRYGFVFTAPYSGGMQLSLGPYSSLSSQKINNPANTLKVRLCGVTASHPDESSTLKSVNYTPAIGTTTLDFSDIPLTSGTEYALTWESNADGLSNINNMWLLLGGNPTGEVICQSWQLNTGTGVWGNTAFFGDDVIKGFLVFGTMDPRPVLINELALTPTDVCDNPIMLFWKNTLGGDSWWMFEKNQEYTIENVAGRKVKRMVLFAENLTLNEWEGLNELISFRETYHNNVIDISTTTRSKSVIGSQVWVVDQEGNATGVVVVPSSFRTETRNETHSLEIEIEFPEIYYQL
jgi:hypothetical protein